MKPAPAKAGVHGADAKADDPIAWYEGSGFSGTNERLLRSDWEGSIVLAADNAGAGVYGVNTYDDYGIPGSANSGRFGYTGQVWLNELGMNYYKARMYSPTLGRFMQTDPIGYKDQMNLYAYVGNDPVDGTDPTGLEQRCNKVTRMRGVKCQESDDADGSSDDKEKDDKVKSAVNKSDDIVGGTGTVVSGVEHGAGNLWMRSVLKNGAFTTKFFGNQYVKAFRMSVVAETVGRYTAALGFVVDVYKLRRGWLSPLHFAGNTTVSVVGLTGGRAGAVAAAAYYGAETFYPGGAKQLARDTSQGLVAAEAEQIGRCNCDQDLDPTQR